MTVEGVRRQAPEVANPGDGDAHQPVEELPHPVGAKGDLCADGVALAELEAGDGLAGARHQRLLAGDDGEVVDGALQQRGLLGRLSDAHVENNLLQAGDLHDVGQAELFLQPGAKLLVVADFEPGTLGGRGGSGAHDRSLPHLRQTRTLPAMSSRR